jgi:NAD+ diphosphatase
MTPPPARISRLVACAPSGRLVETGPEDSPRILLEAAEYESLRSQAQAEYSFKLECGIDLQALDFTHGGAGLADKLPRRTDGEAELPPLPEGFRYVAVRGTLAGLLEEEREAAVRACHLVQWRRRTRFCPHCSAALRESRTETAMECPSCGLVEYPRISPAVIVLIEHKGRIALARNASFTNGMHSCIAGFVESGESFEQTAAREAMEEIGLDIADIKYFGSQPWPFPDSMMVAFRAQARNGDLKPDGKEIVEAGWFGPDNLPPIPRRGSIARAMVDQWLSERGFRTE